LTDGAVEQLEKDLALVLEVAVERADGDLGAARDLRRIGLVVAELFEAGDGGFENLFAGAPAARLLRRARDALLGGSFLHRRTYPPGPLPAAGRGGPGFEPKYHRAGTM
jgi:hypothetical protein